MPQGLVDIPNMAGTYRIEDLLKLMAQESAQELVLQVGRPPMMLLKGKLRVLDGPLVGTAEIQELLGGIATEEQRRELDLCGDSQFQYAREQLGTFHVRAALEGQNLSLRVKNLGR